MLKINKNILIVCVLSLFLLISQASATDTDSIQISDMSNTIDNLDTNIKNVEIQNMDSNDGQTNNNIENVERNTYNEKYLNDGTNLNEGTNHYNDNIGDNPDSSDIYEIDNIKSSTDSSDIYEIDNIESNTDSSNIEDINNIETNIVSNIVTAKDTDGVVMAGDNYSCGPASLATVLNKNGLNLTLKEVSKITNTTENGTTMQSIIDAAKYYNFSAIGVEIDTSDLKENYIVHLNINGSEHWTVITKVTDEYVYLADSSEGNIKLSIDEFNSYFTRKAIIISKMDEISLKEQIITKQITSNIKILDNDQCLKISGKGMKRKVIGYRIVWKYGLIQKYGWVLRPVVSGGHVSFSQWKYVKGYYYVWGKYKVKEPIYKYYYVSDESLTSAKIKK